MQEINELIAEYKAAWSAANKLSDVPDVSYSDGWFTIGNVRHKRFRRSDMMQMRDTLVSRLTSPQPKPSPLSR